MATSFSRWVHLARPSALRRSTSLKVTGETLRASSSSSQVKVRGPEMRNAMYR